MGLLEPAAINTRGEVLPYNSWAPNSVDLGGGTNLQNNLEVDGSPIGLGHKASVVPNTDDVQEVVVSTNSVDAESGHSAGGAISVTTKSGTNEYHGSAFYLGRYPWANAEADRTRFSANATRQNMFGGTLRQPHLEEQALQFLLDGILENWRARHLYRNHADRARKTRKLLAVLLPSMPDVPAAFARSTIRIRTVVNPITGAVTVTPFAGNIVPANRMDPITSNLMSQMWAPNNPGANITGSTIS